MVAVTAGFGLVFQTARVGDLAYAKMLGLWVL